mmetsp:Transcript_6584/g.24645  ORF Transcript_6584/g.24645 Transcript_6584/m.24645 type:complete len:304 (+) Transcript_6584:2385-3296(+)
MSIVQCSIDHVHQVVFSVLNTNHSGPRHPIFSFHKFESLHHLASQVLELSHSHPEQIVVSDLVQILSLSFTVALISHSVRKVIPSIGVPAPQKERLLLVPLTNDDHCTDLDTCLHSVFVARMDAVLLELERVSLETRNSWSLQTPPEYDSATRLEAVTSLPFTLGSLESRGKHLTLTGCRVPPSCEDPGMNSVFFLVFLDEAKLASHTHKYLGTRPRGRKEIDSEEFFQQGTANLFARYFSTKGNHISTILFDFEQALRDFVRNSHVKVLPILNVVVLAVLRPAIHHIVFQAVDLHARGWCDR